MAGHCVSRIGIVARTSLLDLVENIQAAKARPANRSSGTPYPRRNWMHHRGSRLAFASAFVMDIVTVFER